MYFKGRFIETASVAELYHRSPAGAAEKRAINIAVGPFGSSWQRPDKSLNFKFGKAPPVNSPAGVIHSVHDLQIRISFLIRHEVRRRSALALSQCRLTTGIRGVEFGGEGLPHNTGDVFLDLLGSYMLVQRHGGLIGQATLGMLQLLSGDAVRRCRPTTTF